MAKRKRYSPELKAQIVLEILKEEKTISQLASEHEIHVSQLNRWKREALENLPQLFSDQNKTIETVKSEYEKQINDLYAEVGRLTTELSWLKKKSGLKL
ncbi:MAG: transposase [Clostridiales bacterium]|nr:transposase [Clostridiales bacterium]MCF8023288.1 transposase [Clostridiales bacterium]